MPETNVSQENYANCGWIYVPVARSTLKTRREPSLLLQLLAQKVVPAFRVLNRYVREEDTLRSLHNCVVWVSGFWGAEKSGPLFWVNSCSKSDGSLRVLRVE